MTLLQRGVDLLNVSAVPRKIAETNADLGIPTVHVGFEGAAATVTFMWSMGWYRFAVDVDSGAVSLGDRGYEERDDFQPNATVRADGTVQLAPARISRAAAQRQQAEQGSARRGRGRTGRRARARGAARSAARSGAGRRRARDPLEITAWSAHRRRAAQLGGHAGARLRLGPLTRGAPGGRRRDATGRRRLSAPPARRVFVPPAQAGRTLASIRGSCSRPSCRRRARS